MQIKPPTLTFIQAASLPQAGALAIQGLLKGRLQPGDANLVQNILVNGAGGGAGTLAIQIAKSAGAEVTAVDNPAKLGRLISLGADYVIDYTQQDFTKIGRKYDLILDVMGFHSIFNYQQALRPKGRYVMLGGGSGYTAQVMVLGPLISRFSSKEMGILFLKPNRNLDLLTELIESKKVAPVIDRIYPLNETANAFRYYGEGNFLGKIVITGTTEIERNQ